MASPRFGEWTDADVQGRMGEILEDMEKEGLADTFIKGHPWHQRSRGGPAFMLEEWNYLYKERPPPSSRLWKAYQGQL